MKCSPGHAGAYDLAHRSPRGRGLQGSMPQHGFSRCDGHHKMIDFRLRMRASWPSIWSDIDLRRARLSSASSRHYARSRCLHWERAGSRRAPARCGLPIALSLNSARGGTRAFDVSGPFRRAACAATRRSARRSGRGSPVAILLWPLVDGSPGFRNMGTRRGNGRPIA